MTDLSGVGLPPPTMRFLGLLVILGVLQAVASFKCPQVMNQALIGDPNDCRKYYHCLTDGRYFIKSCPNGLVFEPKTKVCVWDSSRSCAPHLLDVAKGDNVIAPVAKEASSTAKSATSTAKKSTTSQKPTTTTKKTVTTSKATNPTTVKATEQTTKITKQTTTVSKATPEAATEIKTTKDTEAVNEDDKKTTPKPTKSETTTADFSTETSSENVTGTSNTTDMRAGENPTDGEETSTAANGVKEESTESFKTVAKKDTPKHSVLKRSPFAQENRIDGGSDKVTCYSAFAYVTDPDNCHTFYHCNNWRPFQKRCPPGLFFDSENLVCNWPHNVNCIEGYRAKTVYSFNSLRRRVRPEANIRKVKVIESTTEKIPFLETIENDVRKVRYEEDSDSTTVQVTVRPYDRTARPYGRTARPHYRNLRPYDMYQQKSSSIVHETSSVPERASEQTTDESTTTESTTSPSTPSTSTDGYMYETHPSESRSTWKDWNFDLFYTNSDRQASDLDKLELFSNGKKVKSENKEEFMSTDNLSDTKSSTAAASSETTTTVSASKGNMSDKGDETTTQSETSNESSATTTTTAPSSSSDSGHSSVSESDSSTDSVPTTISSATSTSEPQYTSDDSENMISTGVEYDSKTSKKLDDETTSVPEISSRAPSFDFGTDEDRERSHPRKVQNDAPAPSDPFMTSDRFAANQQSMYARDYTNVEDVEIEKFMMKMLNDAMQSKHMVARQASEEYPDNLVDGSYDKSKKSEESEMGGSDTLDKWAIADKEGKKSKGTLIEEIAETETEEIESSGEIENFAADTENQMTNLIMKDEGKPAEPETKTTQKSETVTDVPESSENETKVEVVSEVEHSNKTLDDKDDNATSSDSETTTTTKATTTTEAVTTTTVATTTTVKSAETSKAADTETTTKAQDNETTTKVAESTTTVKVSESKDDTTKENSTDDVLPVKAVPLLKDMSDLCTEKNNCSVKSENETSNSTTPEAVTAEKTEVNTTTTTQTETTTTTTTTTATTTTTTKPLAANVTETTKAQEVVNVTEKAEVAKSTTTAAAAENVTKTDITTTMPIAKDAAGKVGSEFVAHSDNSVSKEDKDTLEIEDRHLPLSENATKPDQIAENSNETESLNATLTVSQQTEDKTEDNAVNSTTSTEIVNSTTAINETDSEQTTSADDTSDDVTESTSTKGTSTISMAVDTSSQSGKVLTGGSKGTTKKSFISLSDLIKWYLRHWRHYSRWRDSKEVRSAPQ